MSYTKKNYRNISRTYWVANSTGYNLCWITCHKQSLFSSVSKKQYTSHELTWWYWHIHVALCSTLFFQTFPQKMEIFMKISKKIQENENFLKFSYNYIHLAHFECGCCWWSGAKIYCLVKCNHSDDRLFCAFRSAAFFFIQGDNI